MADPPFGALLCDVDGVLRLWDQAETDELEREFALPAGCIASVAFAPDRLLPAVTGRVPDERWRAEIAGALSGPCGSAERAARLVERWSGRMGTIDGEVLRLLVEARRTMPVVLVSNGTTRLERDLRRLGVAGAVPDLVNSARIGSAKPDPAIYRAAARRAGLPPARCLFVDDTAAFVRGAEAVGMTGHLYRGRAELRAVLGYSTDGG